MSNFTYEAKDTKTKLETFEWDNVWWEHTENTTAPRVLYIGDSISCGIRRVATAKAENKILFDGFGTSKAVDNPYFADTLKIFASQMSRCDAVIFNNGLHGFHLDDETEYKRHFEELVKFLIAEFEGTPVYIVLTTTVANPDREKRVTVRNKVALEIAEKYGLGVIDLYAASVEAKELLTPDGVHFTPAGYEVLAKKVVGTLTAEVEALKVL